MPAPLYLVGGGHNPDVISTYKPHNNMGAEYSQYGDECNFLLFPRPGVKNALAPPLPAPT